MANKRYTLTISKLVLFWVLFVISSIFTYKGFVLLSPIIPHAGRLILTILPVSLLYFVPLLITVMSRRFDMAIGKKEKWSLPLPSKPLLASLDLAVKDRFALADAAILERSV